MYIFLEKQNFKPRLNIMDSKDLQTVKKYITDNDVKYQLLEQKKALCKWRIESHLHSKNHFVVVLSFVPRGFPIFLWDELMPQDEIKLNILQSSRTCPKLLAHAHLHGILNYNPTPLTPAGYRALIYK